MASTKKIHVLARLPDRATTYVMHLDHQLVANSEILQPVLDLIQCHNPSAG